MAHNLRRSTAGKAMIKATVEKGRKKPAA